MNERALTAAVVLALAAALGTGTLQAQPAAPEKPSPANVTRSRDLFDQGRKLAAAGDYATACPLLQAANDLNRTNGTALSLADCYDKLGQPERALPHYKSIVASGDDKFPERVTHARARIEALEAAQSPPPAAPAPAPAAAPSAPSAPSVPPPPSPPPAPHAAVEEGPSRVPVVLAFGVGAAGIVVGSVFGALALSQAGEVDDACPAGRCASDDQVGPQSDAQDSARAKGWVSTIGFGVGVAGVAAGVLLLVTRSDTTRVVADARGLQVRF